MATTLYQLLGVDADADTETIDAAYRRLAKEEHPDVSDHEDAATRFRRIQRAHDVLTDDEKRRRYDRLGHDRYVRRHGDPDLYDGVDATAEDRSNIQRAAASASGDSDRSNSSTRRQRTANNFDDPFDDTDWWTSSGTDGPTNAGATPGWREQERQRQTTATAAAGWGFGSDNPWTTQTETAAGNNDNAETETTDNTATANTASSTVGTGVGARQSKAAGTSTGRTTAGSPTGRDGYAVNSQHRTTRQRSVLATDWDQESVSFALFSFLLYPIMLVSSVHPGFILQINIVVAACTLFLMTYLLTRPGIAVLVFGAWSLLLPVGFVWAGYSLLSAIGLVVVLGTWVPFAYSVAIGLALSGTP